MEHFKTLQGAIETALNSIIKEQTETHINQWKEGLHEHDDNTVTMTVSQVGKLVKDAWTKGVEDACEEIPHEHEVYIDEYDGNFRYEGSLEVDISEVHVDPSFDPDWATELVEEVVFAEKTKTEPKKADEDSSASL